MIIKIKKIKKPIFILLALGAAFAIGGYVAALNGWFGGGAAIPEDTMTRGLVGYWSMDEGGGQTAFDASGNSNNGTLGSSASVDTADPKWIKGKNGGALKFDGVNDYVDAGSAESLNITGAVTVGVWVKANTNWNPSDSDYHNIVAKGSIFNLGYGLEVYERGLPLENKAEFWIRSSSGLLVVPYIVPNNWAVGVWKYLVGVYDGNGNLYLYIDGNKVSQVSAPYSPGSTSNSLFIARPAGAYSPNDLYFNGLIDEVRIYNRALSAEEIRYHYNRGGPVAEWKFDEGSGTKVYDSTENNKNGTLHE